MLRLLDAELPNIRATLEWLRDRARRQALSPPGRRPCSVLVMRGLRREGLGWIEAAAPLVADASSELQAQL